MLRVLRRIRRPLSRRHVLHASAATIVSGFGVGFYTWHIEPHWLDMVRRPLDIEGLPAALEGRTLVQLSDIHVGERVADEYVADTFERVRQLAPDLVV
jgi:uncharacterized protein